MLGAKNLVKGRIYSPDPNQLVIGAQLVGFDVRKDCGLALILPVFAPCYK